MRALGHYNISLNSPVLMDNGRAIQMPLRHHKVLGLLIKAGGRTVTKEAFSEEVWRERFVADGSLSQVIFLLRKTLGTLPDGSSYIETVPKQGYRINPKALMKQERTSSITEGEVQYQVLVDSIEDYAIYMLDCGGRIRSWNLGAERNKGYTADEVIGKHYSIFFVPEDIEGRVPEKQLKAAVQTGRSVGEGWRLRKSGERFWATSVLTAMRDPERKLIGFAKVVRDISARKRQEDHTLRMEATARRDRDRLSAAAESSMDAFWICEAVRDESGEIEDFIFTYLNSNVEKMVSIPRAVLLNGKMCKLLPVNRTSGLLEAYKRVVETGEPYAAEFKVDAEHVLSNWIRVQAVRLDDGVAITAADITERKLAEERILHLAQHDPLTGLSNRSLLDDRISQSIERVKRFGGKVGVCMIDLDDFKPINDTYGHHIGDQVLIRTAQRIQAAVRRTDSVIRVGGDEFVVVLPDNESQGAISKVSAKIVAAICEPMIIDGQSLRLGCSLGMAICPDDGAEVQGLLSFADKEMYKMKTSGKHKHVEDADFSQAGVSNLLFAIVFGLCYVASTLVERM